MRNNADSGYKIRVSQLEFKLKKVDFPIVFLTHKSGLNGPFGKCMITNSNLVHYSHSLYSWPTDIHANRPFLHTFKST